MTNPNKGATMTSNTHLQDDDLTVQIEHAIESVLDLANPPPAADSATGQPFAPEIAPAEGVPLVSDAELEQQALAHPGGDADPSTPE